MKTLNVIALLFIVLVLSQGCHRTIEVDLNKPTFTSYELNGNDTINFVDVNSRKQGHWIVFEAVADKNSPYTKSAEYTLTHDPAKSITASSRTKFEEGNYVDDKKEGVWKYFHSDGSIKEIIEYKNDIAIAH